MGSLLSLVIGSGVSSAVGVATAIVYAAKVARENRSRRINGESWTVAYDGDDGSRVEIPTQSRNSAMEIAQELINSNNGASSVTVSRQG